MNLDDLAIFERVVREGSFTAAARALGMGKSTVSERVSRLESTLGVRLLQRTTRSLRPTDDGAAFYERCQRVVAEAEAARDAVTRSGQVPRGTLRLTCPIRMQDVSPISRAPGTRTILFMAHRIEPRLVHSILARPRLA